jgi:2,4-dienoyl-CoA reductase-like NADH-dependent reductase (Old Yellow Enzyme family)
VKRAVSKCSSCVWGNDDDRHNFNGMCASPTLTEQPSLTRLFEPAEIRGMWLSNRVLMAAIEKNLCTAEGVMTDRYIDYLVARAHRGKVSLELAHCGRQTNMVVSGFRPVAPSSVPCALSGGHLPRALTIDEIESIVQRFVSAALRGRAAGLDAIEIHGASGYLLNAFRSPCTNLRDD